MLNSLILSLFFFVFLCAEVFLPAFNFFNQKSRKLNQIPALYALFGIVLTIILSVIITSLILASNNLHILQLLYFIIFGLSLVLCPFLITAKYRLVGLSVSIALLIALFFWPLQSLQNIVMATALLWVGPFIVNQQWLRPKYFFSIFSLAGLIDIYNIVIAPSNGAENDITLILNGNITFSEYSLGIGDFLFGAIAVAWLNLYCGKKSTIIAAVLIAFIRFCIRLLFPSLGDIPYLAVISLVAIATYYIYKKGGPESK